MCSRVKGNDTSSASEAITQLLGDQWIVPLLRDDDGCLLPRVGQPCSPQYLSPTNTSSTSPPLSFSPLSPATLSPSSPISPHLKVGIFTINNLYPVLAYPLGEAAENSWPWKEIESESYPFNLGFLSFLLCFHFIHPPMAMEVPTLWKKGNGEMMVMITYPFPGARVCWAYESNTGWGIPTTVEKQCSPLTSPHTTHQDPQGCISQDNRSWERTREAGKVCIYLCSLVLFSLISIFLKFAYWLNAC